MFERVKPHFDSINEECGVFGIYSNEQRDIAKSVYYGTYALQHRGQQSCGIAVSYGNQIAYTKGAGLLSEVFNNNELNSLPEGDIAIGHVRYASAGSDLDCNSQPLVLTGKIGKVAICYNGRITNLSELRKKLILENVLFQTTTGAEVIAALINKFYKDDVVDAIKLAAKELKGSYCFLVMTINKLIAVRDSFGMRPLVLGKLNDEFVVSSETCGLDTIKAKFIKDIEPGEILVIDSTGIKSHFLSEQPGLGALCVFEYVYLARPDSVIDGCSVYEVRKKSGRVLAEKYPVDADIVAGVPDSALVSAIGYSEVSKIPYAEALIKNRYVGRTFIQPEQKLRENTLNIKLNALRTNVENKRVILIDDSIVRGTTSKRIVEMLRFAGAKEVHLRICSPIIPHPCYFGIDTQSKGDLIGNKKNAREIRDYVNADSLEFLTIEELTEICKACNTNLCMGCFSGKYPITLKPDEIDEKHF